MHQRVWCPVPVTEVQWDELWRFMARQHATETGADGDSTEEHADGRPWVWVSFAPECRLLLAASVGPRTFQSALRLIQMTTAVVRGSPCCCSDGFSRDLPALVAVSQQMQAGARTGPRGRPRHPGPVPHPALVEAPLIKHTPRGRLLALTERVCCGAARLAALERKISPRLIERLAHDAASCVSSVDEERVGRLQRPHTIAPPRGLLPDLVQLGAAPSECATSLAPH